MIATYVKSIKQNYKERTAELQETNIELQKEQEKSDRLLLNILPESIAARLKDGQIDTPTAKASGFYGDFYRTHLICIDFNQLFS